VRRIRYLSKHRCRAYRLTRGSIKCQTVMDDRGYKNDFCS